MARYTVKDDNGSTLQELVGVLDPVALAGVGMTSGSNILTVTNTDGVFPGMVIKAPNIPAGAFVHAVKSDTQLELWASAWNATEGVFTTSSENAEATADGSDLTALALGFDPRTQVAQCYAQGTWRNTIRSAASVPVYASTSFNTSQPGSVQIPAYLTKVTSDTTVADTFALTPTATILSDEVSATPLKRHNGEHWGVYIVVCTGGHQCLVPANPKHSIAYAGADS